MRSYIPIELLLILILITQGCKQQPQDVSNKFLCDCTTYGISSTFDTPIAKIVFFDTRQEIGIFTEIMGITDGGIAVIEKMKGGTAYTNPPK